MKKLLTFIICFSLTLPVCWAQQATTPPAEGAAAGEGEDDILATTGQDVILVAAAGLGGAVVGLSTLSFYEKPSKHIKNIWMGAAIGIVGGVIWVAYSSAQRGQEQLSEEYEEEGDSAYKTGEFSTSRRVAWHHDRVESFQTFTPDFSATLWQKSF